MKSKKGYSLYIYGSCSRGDSVKFSDVDLLVVIENHKDMDKDSIVIPDEIFENNKNVDVSYYSLDRLKKMYDAGHLYAWHLYKEAKYLNIGVDYLKELKRPSKYNLFVNDVLPLVELLESTREEIGASKVNLIYEAGLVYVCARNIAMSASYFSPAGLTFSTYAPFFLGYNDNYFPIDRDNYEKLRRARLAGSRGIEPLPITEDELLEYMDDVIEWASIEYRRMCSEEY